MMWDTSTESFAESIAFPWEWKVTGTTLKQHLATGNFLWGGGTLSHVVQTNHLNIFYSCWCLSNQPSVSCLTWHIDDEFNSCSPSWLLLVNPCAIKCLRNANPNLSSASFSDA